jgi:hypothetical protein
VGDDGVQAEVRFRDVDGRQIEILVDDRDGRPRRRAGLLAPFGAGIEHPTSLLLAWMPGFDLVRVAGTPPKIRIDGHDAATGRLPGRLLHRRHLIKYAAPLLTVELNRHHEGPLSAVSTGERAAVSTSGRLGTLTAVEGDHHAKLVLDPGLPPLDAVARRTTRETTRQTLPQTTPPMTCRMTESGRWHIEVDRARLTGGTWSATGTASGVHLEMDVDERWRPGRLPWLMQLVTTLVPVFRRWPTTYRWRCDVRLDGTPSMTSSWERTGSGGADSYRRATGS